MASAEEEPLPRLVQQVEPDSNTTQEMNPDSRNTTQETSPDANSSQETSQSPAVPAALKDFQDLHDKTYAVVQKGLNADEEGDVTAAQHHYTSCLPLLEQILATNCETESWKNVSAADKDAAWRMKLKTVKTRLQVISRLESLQQPPSPETYLKAGDAEVVRLPSYEEAVSSGPSSPVSETGAGIMGMTSGSRSLPAGERLSMQGTELFSIADGVQIFYITCDGYVSAPSYPTSLHVIRFEESDEAAEGEGGGESRAQGADRVFLQVGEWLYPLLPETSPILHTSFGAYLFPDLSPDGTGSSVGMLPNTQSEEELHLLEDILRNFAIVQNQQPLTPTGEEQAAPSAPGMDAPGMEEPGAGAEVTEAEVTEEGEPGRCRGIADHSTSAMISRGILTASSWISWGLEKGAEKAGHWINLGSTKLRGQLQPEQRPPPVDSRIKKGAMYARKATHTAVCVSTYVVTKLGEATVALGRQVAPHLRRKGGELLPNSVKTKENKSRLHGVVQVASSGLRGFGTVWLGLERAAKALGRSIATETVATVQHKYGEEAGKVAEDTVYAAGNVAITAYTAESLAARAIVRRTARDAGSAVVQELQQDDDDDDKTEEKQETSEVRRTARDAGSAVVQELQQDDDDDDKTEEKQETSEVRRTARDAGSAVVQELQQDEDDDDKTEEKQETSEVRRTARDAGSAVVQELQQDEDDDDKTEEKQETSEVRRTARGAGSAVVQELQQDEDDDDKAEEKQETSEVRRTARGAGSAVVQELQDEDDDKTEEEKKKQERREVSGASEASQEDGDTADENQNSQEKKEKKPPV